MIAGLQGIFTVRVYGPCGTLRKKLRFPNLILNNGLNGIGTLSTNYVLQAALGTGTAAPDVAQTGLISPGVSTSTTGPGEASGFVAGPPPYSWQKFSRRFAAGTATGNWTEIGIGNTATDLWSRALILDGGGSPTTLTVLAIEVVDIEYELRLYPSITDKVGTKTIGGVSYGYTLRPAFLSAYAQWPPSALVSGNWMSGGMSGGNNSVMTVFSGAMGAYTSAPSGASAAGTVGLGAVASYSNNSYTKVVTAPAGVDGANVSGGIKSVMVMMGPGNNTPFPFQCEFSSSIPKDNTKTISFAFSIQWGRRP